MKFYVVNREAAKARIFSDVIFAYDCQAIMAAVDMYGKKPSVLVVGEGANLYESLQQCLSGNIASLHFATTGRHALDYFRKMHTTPGIVFTDADLPDMSCRKLKECMEDIEMSNSEHL